jgi:TolB-like protein/DNA-binding winged helix-turn-helix (wHTH) protein
MTRITFDDWTLVPATGELLRGDTKVRLQEQPLQVLLALLSRPGQLITRDELIARLWPADTVAFDVSLNTVVRKVRIALGDDADHPRYIETIPRRGYRFIGKIVSQADDSLRELKDADVPSGSAASESGAPGTPPIAEAVRHSPLTWSTKIALASILVLSAAVAAGFLGRHLLSFAPDTAAARTKPRIAILPFVNLSPDTADAFFADGIHEEIISTLATGALALEVVPRTTMMMYRMSPAPVARVASDLNAEYILEGSVRRDSTAVRLTLQLVDGRSQRYLWSRNYDRSIGNSLSLQSDVAKDVASRLEIALGPTNHRLTTPTSDPEAYDAYLKSRLLYRDGDWSGAAAMASKAIERDREFGAAYVTRSAAYDMQIVFNIDTSEERLEAQSRDLKRARQLLGDDDPLVLTAQAMFLAIGDRDYGTALDRFAAAEAAGLKDPAVLRTRAMQLVVMGRMDEAISSHRSLAALDPGNFVLVNSMAVLLSLAHRPGEAKLVSDLVLDRFPENAVAHLTHARLIFAYTGRTERWRAAYEKTLPTLNVDRRIMEQFDLLRYQGRFAELRNLLEAERDQTIGAGTFNGLTLCCVGKRPLAEYRGWTALLMNDVAAAGREGREVLGYARSVRPTRWNDWYLQLLRAEGLVMTGDRSRAVRAARASLALVPPAKNAVNWRYAAAVAARIFAWGGAPDEAVATLEALDAARPGLCPAEMTHDPLYQMPLERYPRYELLRARLEREMNAVGSQRQ